MAVWWHEQGGSRRPGLCRMAIQFKISNLHLSEVARSTLILKKKKVGARNATSSPRRFHNIPVPLRDLWNALHANSDKDASFVGVFAKPWRPVEKMKFILDHSEWRVKGSTPSLSELSPVQITDVIKTMTGGLQNFGIEEGTNQFREMERKANEGDFDTSLFPYPDIAEFTLINLAEISSRAVLNPLKLAERLAGLFFPSDSDEVLSLENRSGVRLLQHLIDHFMVRGRREQGRARFVAQVPPKFGQAKTDETSRRSQRLAQKYAAPKSAVRKGEEKKTSAGDSTGKLGKGPAAPWANFKFAPFVPVSAPSGTISSDSKTDTKDEKSSTWVECSKELKAIENVKEMKIVSTQLQELEIEEKDDSRDEDQQESNISDAGNNPKTRR